MQNPPDGLCLDWAKTKDGQLGISVRQHLYAVYFVALELVRRRSLPPAWASFPPCLLAFLAGIHDVGKHARDFLQQASPWLERLGLAEQARRENWKSLYMRPHPQISETSFLQFLQRQGVSDGAFSWSVVIGAHHGKILSPPVTEVPSLRLHEKPLEEERQQLIEELWTYAGKPVFPNIDENDGPLWFVSGLIILADWIGSDEQFFPADLELTLPELQARAQRAVENLGLGAPEVIRGLSFQALFGGNTPYPLQSMTAEQVRGPGVYVVEAPMGMGKTEAALYAAYGLLQQGLATGVYFALPTQATSNRIFLRFKAFVEVICPNTPPVQLIHGHSWLQEDLKALAAPACGRTPQDYSWFCSAKRALFAPFGVGTVDQALLAAVAARYFALRRYALAGKVVILDEIHSYDVYTGTLIRILCQELEALGCTIIILSATLTATLRAALLGEAVPDETALEPYPYLTCRYGSQKLAPLAPPSVPDKRITIRHVAAGEAQDEVAELAGQGGLVLWICNTVRQAQQMYAALQARFASSAGAPELGLLHARFPFYRREALEALWMERFGKHNRRGSGAILVSTQIVEQSVDLDADVLVSELAPTDMLLQRLGRLWRHSRGTRVVPAPLFYLLNETETFEQLLRCDARAACRALGTKAKVYEPYALLRTLEQWERRDSVALPSEIRSLIAATYEDRDIPEGWEKLDEERYAKLLASKNQAYMTANIWQAMLDDLRVATRLSLWEEYAFVLCRGRDRSGAELLESGKRVQPEVATFVLATAKQLHRNVIRIPDWCFSSRPEEKTLSAYHLDGYASVVDGTLCVPGLRPGVQLEYSDECGLVIQTGRENEPC